MYMGVCTCVMHMCTWGVKVMEAMMLDSPRFDAGVTYQKVASGRRGESGGEGV